MFEFASFGIERLPYCSNALKEEETGNYSTYWSVLVHAILKLCTSSLIHLWSLSHEKIKVNYSKPISFVFRGTLLNSMTDCLYCRSCCLLPQSTTNTSKQMGRVDNIRGGSETDVDFVRFLQTLSGSVNIQYQNVLLLLLMICWRCRRDTHDVWNGEKLELIVVFHLDNSSCRISLLLFSCPPYQECCPWIVPFPLLHNIATTRSGWHCP